MKSVIKMSRAAVAMLLLSATLVGCGGGGSGDGSGVSYGNGGSDATRSATLSWNAPATRINGDGIAMGEIQGYIIRYGHSADDLAYSVEINDGSVMDYTISGLQYGNWYFTIQVVDMDGLMSAPSDVVSKTI